MAAVALRAGRHAPVAPATVLRHAPWPAAPASTAVDAAGLADAASLAALARLLDEDEAARRDVAFLYASAWLVRCDAPRGHDLVRLAARAALPVLQAAGQALRRRPQLSAPLYDTIRGLAARSACASPPSAQKIGPHALHVAPADYANRFPDSYYRPDTDPAAPPAPHQDLHAAASDPCTSVAYAVLPLRADTPWQCVGARQDARRRIVAGLCHAGGAAGAGAPPALAGQQAMAGAIHELLGKLPDMCQ